MVLVSQIHPLHPKINSESLTGPIGQRFCAVALTQHYELTVITPASTELSGTIQSQVNIIEGDLTDPDTLRRAAQQGANILVSFILPSENPIKRETVCAH